MPPQVHAAVIQMNARNDKPANVDTAVRLVERAAQGGARFVLLPEMFNYLATYQAVAENAEPIPGPTSERMSDLAAQLGITLAAGSITERDAETGRVYNTSLLFALDGRLLARYRKIHLFDVDVPGRVTVQESQWISPGEEVSTIETDAGIVGQSIC